MCYIEIEDVRISKSFDGTQMSIYLIFQTLRFEAVLESIWPADKDRRFVFTYYLADDTISIFEPIPANAGRTGGRFLIRLIMVLLRRKR